MLITTTNLDKFYGAKCALSDINIAINDTSRIGLVGENGAGKSTLLNILTGQLDYENGSIEKKQCIKIGYLKQNSGLNLQNSIWEEMTEVFRPVINIGNQLNEIQQEMSHCTDKNKLEELTKKLSELTNEFELQDGYNYEFKIKSILYGMGFMKFDKNAITANLSGGEKTRLALAKLLLSEPDLLILDEPTNHLDFDTLMWLEDYLQNYKGAVLIVSHDRYFLDKTVTEIWEIEDTKLDIFKGNYSKFVVLKNEKIKRLEKEYEIQQRQIESMEDFIAKNIVRASTTKSAQSRRTKLEKMDKIEKPKTSKRQAKIHFNFDRSPVKDILHIENLTLNVGTKENITTLCQNITVDILRGEKVAFIGANGIGKSTFLKTILSNTQIVSELGVERNTLSISDKLAWGGNARIGYYDQENHKLHSNKRVIDELWDRFPRMYEQDIRTALGCVLFTGENVFKKVCDLSGGEKARLSLAILMLEKPNILVMDEPTNHIDIQTKEVLDNALVEFEGTVILVSHDRYLLNKIPSKIYEITPNGADCYKGKFDFYLANRINHKLEKSDKPKEKNEGAVKHYRSKKDRAKMVANKKRIENIEVEIEENESKIDELQILMTTDEVSKNYEKLQEICNEVSRLRELNDKLTNEWVSLSEEIE